MNVTELIITQGGLRLPPEDRRRMLDYVRQGGVFDAARAPGAQCAPIAIDAFDDGLLYLRDGLHRVTCIYAARIERRLHPSEYAIERMTYEMYTEIDLKCGWCTPFDPRSEVRLPDIADFKTQVQRRLRAGTDPTDFIIANRHQYCRPRQSSDSVHALAQRWS